MERRHVRFLTLLVSLLVLVSLCATTAFAAELTITEDPFCYIHGDVNGDGEVGTQDAIYALYYAMWHDVDPDLYPQVNQQFDFTGEGKVSAKDAIYLLYASHELEGYPLKGEMHEHYKPYWTWDTTGETPTATLTIRCGCTDMTGEDEEKKPVILGEADGVEITSVTTEATCVAAGKVEYTAKVTYLGKEYVSEEPYVVVIPVSETGHDFGGAVRNCENGVTCQNPGCDTDPADDILTPYSLPALGHVLVLDEQNSYAATCESMGRQVYACANEGCGYAPYVDQEKLPHHYEYVEGGDHLVDGTTCTYVKTYKCSVGGETIDGTAEEDVYIKHVYTAAMTLEPNCQEKGLKTYTCSVDGCEDSYTEDVASNDVHHWNDGVTSGNITTYTCKVSGCGETKTAVVPDADGTITKEALDSATELKVGDDDTSVALGSNALSDLKAEDTVEISVTKVTDLSSTNLDAGELEQVDGNAVYNFSLKVNGEPQSEFGGEITVTIPYTLQPGDDIDSIDIWYIDDNGNLAPEPMKGVYCNGYVTFKTTHFSYYTVTRLTPAERCQRYGHIWVNSDKTATCTEGGYSMSVCQRCGVVDEDNKTIIAPLGHDYVNGSNALDATCTEPGRVHKYCQRGDCDHVVMEEIPALGHVMEKNEDRSVANSCYNPGVLVTECANCDLEVVEDLPQLQHNFGDKVETEHPTCNSSGKKHQTCTICGDKIKVEDIVPLGHDFMVATNGWHWNEDRTSATVDLVCRNNPGHTQTRKAAVTLDEAASKPATCTAGGYLVYTATSSFNKATFTDTVTVEQKAIGHVTSGEWEKNASQHYRFCDVCGLRADYAEHTLGNVTVTKAPTCKDSGSASASCLVCGYTVTETLQATGEHNLVNGVCSDCGFAENTCNHTKLRPTLVEVNDPNVCPGLVLRIEKCDCGAKGASMIWESSCDFESEFTNEPGVFGEVMDCKNCDLHYEYMEVENYDEATCTSTFVVNRKFTVGDTVLADNDEPNQMIWTHPSVETGVVIDLADYGLCHGELIQYACRCGELTYYGRSNLCSWSGGEPCPDCGAEWTTDGDEYKQDCFVYYDSTTVVKIGGEEVLSFDEKDIMVMHDDVLEEYELLGETCEDGIYLYYVCKDCGHESYTDVGFHLTALATTQDLTGYGSCADVFTHATCVCGAEEIWYEGDNEYMELHNWQLVSQTNTTTVETCSDCNYTRTTSSIKGAKDANCMVEVDWSVKYTDGKGHEYGASKTAPQPEHKYEDTYELLGSTCEDGVRAWYVCADCGDGFVIDEYTGHRGYAVEHYDMAQYGICPCEVNLYSCACGQDVWVSLENGKGCQNIEWIDGGNNYYVERCNDCGTEWKCTFDNVAAIDTCHKRVRYTYEYSRNGQHLLTITWTTVETSHRDVSVYDLHDADQGCDGGYDVTITCLDCGETWIDENCYGHNTRVVARQAVSTNQLCGDLEMITESCACGENYWTNESWPDGSCDFYWTDYDNARDCEISTCIKCGAVRETSYVWTPIAGETCKQQGEVTVSYFKNGIAAGTYKYEDIGYNHDERNSFTLLGQTCEDGYLVSSYCADCGEQTGYDEEVRYGCTHYHLEDLYTLSVPGMCSDITLNRNGCACGRVLGIGWSGMCDSTNIGWDDINDCGINQCVNCNVIWYDSTTQEDIDGTCFANQTIDWRFELNGEPVGNFTGTYMVSNHKEVATFTMYGQTCEEGWTVERTCVKCGMSDQHEGYYHDHMLLEYYDLAEYGTCGGFYEVYGCGCGENYGHGTNEKCNFQWLNYDDATGESVFYCTECNTYKYVGSTGTRDPNTCAYVGVDNHRFVRNGQDLLTISTIFKGESHDMVLIDLTIEDPSVGCTSGVHAVEACSGCGYTNQISFDEHRGYLVEEIDLSSGCGGALRFYSCPCGQEKAFDRDMKCQNMTNTYTHSYDADGVQHNYHTDTCKTCGLVIETESYAIFDDNSCDVYNNDIYNITYNGQTYNHTHVNIGNSHDLYFTNATLPDGMTNCEEGVFLDWTCRNCGETGTSTAHGWHPLYAAETIDLAPYGAICGGQLVKTVCACGAEAGYDFSLDSKCDPGKQDTPVWIPNTINETQDTSTGYIDTYSHAWLVKCAVTDPDPCGLTIRMAQYWLNENCMAVEYQTWQLGYDETTGTYVDEITIATGRKHAYHPYVATDFNNTLADGSTEFGTNWVCPDCGSYAYHKDTHNANGLQTKFECRYVNTMYATNGENQERSDLSEFGYYANGLNYVTRYYNEWIHADGYVEWSQNLYSNYDFSNNTCTRTNTWTCNNSSSEGSWGGVTKQESAHVTTCEYYNDPDPTCTQRGEEFHAHDCIVCNNVEIVGRWDVEPTGHDFYYDSAKETYVCSVCELESINGVMGAIYMEDMTKDTDAFYTIGYWNRDKIQFQPMVSVILDDVTDDDNQFVLTGISFNYLTVKDNGVCALTFSKAEAETAAQQLISDRNYSGSYAIRISFVPTNGTNELDYAITFDSQNTAQ